jgi:hypothetical protein
MSAFVEQQRRSWSVTEVVCGIRAPEGEAKLGADGSGGDWPEEADRVISTQRMASPLDN